MLYQNSMRLTVTTSASQTLTYSVDDACRTDALKSIIYRDHPEWPVECMKLVSNGTELADHETLRRRHADPPPRIRLVIAARECIEHHTIDPQLRHWYEN